MDVRDAVSDGSVRPLSGRIFLRLLTPHVSSILHLPAHFGGSDAEVVCAPEDSILKKGDTVLVDRYEIVFLGDEPHDAGAIVYCWFGAIRCWTAGDELLPFPGWLLCKQTDIQLQPSLLIRQERRDELEVLEVIKDGSQPECYTDNQPATSPTLPATENEHNTGTNTKRVLVSRAAGFDIIYCSQNFRLVSTDDCLCEIV